MTTILVQYAHGVLVSSADPSVQFTKPLPSFNPQITDLPANPLAVVDGTPAPGGPMSLPGQSTTVVAPEGDDTNKEAPVVSEGDETTKDEAQKDETAPEVKETPAAATEEEKAE